MLFDTWASLGKTLLAVALTYPLLLVVLRLGGKRTLSKMNAFDFVVTVAVGSLVASTVLSGTPIANGIAAVAALVALQALVTWLSVRSDWFEALVKSRPTLVFHNGRFLEDAMRHERVTREEIRTALRTDGVSRVEGVSAVVLESDGSFSVMESVEGGKAEALAGVRGTDDAWRIEPAEGAFADPSRGPFSGS